MQRKLILLVCTGGLLAAAFWLWRAAHRDPDIAYLPRHAPAEWIVYPKPTVPYLQAVAELPALFRRSFSVPQVPAKATLSVRAFRTCLIAINGRTLPAVPPGRNWKDLAQVDARPYLRPGDNSISVTVFNQLARRHCG